MKDDLSSIILIVGFVGVTIYLLYAYQQKQLQKTPLQEIEDDIGDMLSGIGSFFNNFEFNSDSGDPTDDSNVFIPTM